MAARGVLDSFDLIGISDVFPLPFSRPFACFAGNIFFSSLLRGHLPRPLSAARVSPMRLVLFSLLLSVSLASAQSIQLTDSQALEIGRRIWKNECAGTVNGLTTWNGGEEFASLGIGHFIWYPEGKKGPFQESFPSLIVFLKKQGVDTPAWTQGPCPWKTKAQFQAAFDSAQMVQLRTMLKNTIPQQARFAAQRLEQALPQMLAAAPANEREKIRTNFYRVAAQPLGLYALMDYVNFKGEGVKSTERYNGQGWGLLQVLAAMPASGPALPAFAKAADQMLTLRVKNSPPERNEAKWLPGWRNRVYTYTN
jgi:hypothetical protein